MEQGVIIFIVAVICIVAGAVGGYLVARVRTVVLATQLEEERRRVEQLTSERETAMRNMATERETASREASLQREALEAARVEAARLQEQLRQQSEERQALRKETELVFREIAGTILDEKSKAFKESNESRLAEILAPFKENVDSLQKAIHDCYTGEVSEVKSLKESIKELRELNTTIGREAKELSGALRGNSKVQGDWGEMILRQILEKSGLEEGVNYSLQATDNADGTKIKGEEENQLRPDAIFHLPEGKNIVIDSKTNIKHYIDYTNAPEAERAALLAAHIKSVNEQVRGLASKDYQRYVKDAADFVMMFIPNEGAYTAAMQGDADLWEKAYKQHVVIVSPTHLISVLKLMYQLWTRDKQTKNALEIARQTGDLYDKLAGFVSDLEGVGKALKKASEAHDEACKKLSTGKGNILSRVDKIKQLGIKTTKSLPEGEE
ncbi:MAG: DNA recombination protein RmuC [Alistipes sp.]|nr:DNA recombination protein RmuC [Alistipes sp.]